jgi:tRNA (guanine-N7-)-methyltransferase
MFVEGEVNEIWLTFPDPQPKRSKVAKRLTSSYYLDIYKQVLTPGGCIHLKTDSELLFHYTKEVIHKLDYTILEIQEDVYQSEIQNPILAIQTYYEKMWLEQGHKIYYIKFTMI